jgi:hypothetical protein
VVVWSQQSSQVYGQLAARGGLLGGDGGAIETSSKGVLAVTKAADASASQGHAGMWLLDPNNVTIAATGTPAGTSGNPNFVTTADGALILASTINSALSAGTSVTVSTSTGGAQLGDISITGAITSTSNTDVTLTLVAHNNINISAGLTASGAGKLNVVLQMAASGASGTGVATLAMARCRSRVERLLLSWTPV